MKVGFSCVHQAVMLSDELTPSLAQTQDGTEARTFMCVCVCVRVCRFLCFQVIKQEIYIYIFLNIFFISLCFFSLAVIFAVHGAE